MSRDDWMLSLYLDGRLGAAEMAELQARLARDPELAAQLESLQKLQALTDGLPELRAEFTGPDLRARDESIMARTAWWKRAGIAAAAVLALAVSHGLVFWLGSQRTAAPEEHAAEHDREPVPEGRAKWVATDRDPIEATEAVLTHASKLDPEVPYQKLHTELIGLRERIDPLPTRLEAWAASRPPMRARVAELTQALVSLEVAFEEVKDPGILSIAVSSIARQSLRGRVSLQFVPSTAQRYARVVPVGKGRFRLVIVNGRRPGDVVQDEGTLEELKTRHAVEWVVEKPK